MQKLQNLAALTVVLLAARLATSAEVVETVTGTIFGNNNASLYVNGKLVAADPVPIAPHNAFNVSFEIPVGADVTFAIEAHDYADDVTGLELNDRCLGAGGLRAFFSNGVVTNSSWRCRTWHYGPVNWKQCFAAADRAPELKVLPACLFNVSEDDGLKTGCFSRVTPIPEGWTAVDFDDSGWEFATEWEDDYTRPFVWPAFPEGCENPNTVISPQLDKDGNNITCPSNIDWGESKFIWRPDIDLDNRILCRYTLSLGGSGSLALLSTFSAAVMLSAVAVYLTT